MSAIKAKTENTKLRIRDCGLTVYRDALELQKQLVEQRQQNKIPDTILILEHKPVITLGARKPANKLLTNIDKLKEKGIDIAEIKRGGGVTAHNQGQLVFYPILNIKELNLGVNEYVRVLERIGMKLLKKLGVAAQIKKGLPGLWVNERKIASIGVRVSKFVTYHGMAINICNDLDIFRHFVPCGIEGVQITSVLKETSRKYPMADVKKILSDLLNKNLTGLKKNPSKHRRLPDWLKRPLPAGQDYNKTSKVLSSLGLETICTNANCPNRGQCWQRSTATVLILGNICTRNCKFCSVPSGKPQPPDPTEPERLAEMAKQMNLKYLVITSVNRDDLPDGGATHFRDCINEVRKKLPHMKFEILTPDFKNCQNLAIETLRDALPFVFGHNIETVPSLYPAARAGSSYELSLNLLKLAKQTYESVQTKSSLMLGLGETDGQIQHCLNDLRNVGCDRITIGQYLKPSKDSLDVVEYIPPEKFDFWKQKALEAGFSWVISTPFARSSYMAEKTHTL